MNINGVTTLRHFGLSSEKLPPPSRPLPVASAKHANALRRVLPVAAVRVDTARTALSDTLKANQEQEAALLNGPAGERLDAMAARRAAIGDLAAATSDLATLEYKRDMADLEAALFYTSVGTTVLGAVLSRQ